MKHVYRIYLILVIWLLLCGCVVFYFQYLRAPELLPEVIIHSHIGQRLWHPPVHNRI